METAKMKVLNAIILTVIFTLLFYLLPYKTMAQEKTSQFQTKVINAGVGGQNSSNILARLDEVLKANPDTLVLMAGTNDVLNSQNPVPPDQYRQNIEKIINTCKSKNIRLVILTILPCYEPYLFQRHSPEFFQPESPSEKIKLANTIIKDLAQKYDLILVDTHRIFEAIGQVGESQQSLIRNVLNSNAADGVHPTPQGYQVLATAVFQALYDKNITPKILVCLGDSITAGAHVEGFGTAVGQTYPACLSMLLNN